MNMMRECTGLPQGLTGRSRPRCPKWLQVVGFTILIAAVIVMAVLSFPRDREMRLRSLEGRLQQVIGAARTSVWPEPDTSLQCYARRGIVVVNRTVDSIPGYVLGMERELENWAPQDTFILRCAISVATLLLPDSIVADSVGDVGTVVLIDWSRAYEGEWTLPIPQMVSDGGPANPKRLVFTPGTRRVPGYTVNCKVTVIDWREQRPAGVVKEFRSKPIVPSVKVRGTTLPDALFGHSPLQEVADYIASLPTFPITQ